MAEIIRPNFGSPAQLQRAKLADALQAIAEHIRANELQYDPHGFLLVLESDLNPRQCEVLHVGIQTVGAMERIAFSVKSRAAETLNAGHSIRLARQVHSKKSENYVQENNRKDSESPKGTSVK